MSLQAVMESAAWPYVLLIIGGFLPTEIWRVLGVVLSRGISEGSPFLVWVRAVATALLAAVVAKLVLHPSGALAAVPLAGRLGGIAVGLAGFFLFRRSLIAGVLIGETVLIGTAWWATRV